MTCRELAAFMMAYVDGELQDDQRRRFDEHLAMCPDCVRYLREYRATVHVGRLAYTDEPPAEVPEDLVQAIRDARKSCQPRPLSNRPRRPRRAAGNCT